MTRIDTSKIEKRPVPKTPTDSAPADTVLYFRGGGARVALREWNQSYLYVNVFNDKNVRIHVGLIPAKEDTITAADVREYVDTKVN